MTALTKDAIEGIRLLNHPHYQAVLRRLIYFEFQSGRTFHQIARVLEIPYSDVQEEYRQFVLSHKRLTTL